ncbi:anti-sigma factor family protein [Streptomyces sp. NPDC014894]|uniref:anti-sigma factor family protein n=1 Tax=Streptomyces sp. NPDC014894 TaxID=3364931 RepID=UPI0036FC5F6F
MSGFSPTPAEQHLGDRLAALVDGELKHDARDRVLAHLATCPKCKAEADAQRRLKDVFAQAAPPPPSEGLLARLQGLPAGPGADDRGGPFDGGRVIDSIFAGVTPSSGRPGDRRPETFGYVPEGHPAAPALPGRSGGFRIHEVGRPEGERSPWRARRFAFAAASAVSFAAIALGGAMPVADTSVQSARGATPGNAVTPMQAGSGSGPAGAGSGLPTTSAGARSAEFERRRGATQAPARSDERVIGRSVPGPLTPGDPLHRPLSVPAALGTAALAPPPLIRPTSTAFSFATAATPGPVLSATPAPTHLVAPAHPAPPLASTR